MFAAIVGQAWADDAHPFNLEINGIDRIAITSYPTISIEMPGPGSNGSMSFSMDDVTGTADVSEWDEVRFIEHAATQPIQFGGFVQSVKYSQWANGVGRTATIQCVGYGVLLDKKAVPTYPSDNSVFRVAYYLVSAINRHGGRITGLAGVSNTSYSDIDLSVSQIGNVWTAGLFAALGVPDNSTLRTVIETIMANSQMLSVDPPLAASGTYWVDSYARLRAYPDVDSTEILQYRKGQFYEGAIPGLTVDATGAMTVVRIDYEREDIDRLTSAYVVGSTGAGTGYYRTQGLERAGDLESIVSDTGSTVANDIAVKGAPEVRRTATATARGEVEIWSETPLDIWPGRNVQVTAPALGLTSALDWRITSTQIRFQSSTNRVYVFGFGGNLPPPRASRRTGRFRTRPVGSGG